MIAVTIVPGIISSDVAFVEFLDWLENSALGMWVAQSVWGYPVVLSAHAVGMAIVVGTALMIGARVLGYANAVPPGSFRRLYYVVWGGVALNLLSGLALFSGNPSHFFQHPVFWVKLGLIMAGATAVWLLLRSLGADPVTARAKVIAACSIAFWLGAIIAGRLIAYIEIG